MKRTIPVFFIFYLSLVLTFGNNTLFAQQSYTDSLETLLETTASDTLKIPYYYNLTEYYISNAPEKAIPIANKFLLLGEKLNRTDIIDYCYLILGEAHYYQDNLHISLKYFNSFLENQKQQKNRKKLAQAYNSLGIVYRAMDNYPKAINYYNKARDIYQELNDTLGLNNVYNNLGVLHEYLNLFSQAHNYYQKSLGFEKLLNNPEGISTSYLNLGGINFKLKQYEKALDYCHKAIPICDSLGYRVTLEMIYELMYEIYRETDQPQQALNYFEKFYAIKNQRVNQETNAKIAELEIKYETDKKQKEIEILNKQKKQKTTINIILLITIGIVILQALILLKIIAKRKRNNQILRLQNEEMLKQNEEIETQRDEIEAQRDEIQRQKEFADKQTEYILRQNKDITDSIEYAKHIQVALFPDKLTLQKILRDGFCLFKPKDIVSGDFYWVAEVNGKSVIVGADCTGHGVPGAFMSIIGINFLNEIVFDEHELNPAEILNRLRKKVVKTLVHSNRIEEAKDGMDISLVIIDHENMKLEYAGAYNHLYFIRGHMLEVIKADRMPVGLSAKAMKPFTNHTIDLQPGDLFYMFTDGYADQFGGPLRKKFRIGNLRELLLEIHDKNIQEQKQILYESFINWKGDQPQVDDVLVLGFKI
ncbi:MAG: tetratricopeptide repeat protein [Bacteroidales bacterium]|jgi:serine phosphatase RsbU (regulator of sigma subunit)|nr:tetratricopeptide repeat protein [Bacteroidales bacterium]